MTSTPGWENTSRGLAQGHRSQFRLQEAVLFLASEKNAASMLADSWDEKPDETWPSIYSWWFFPTHLKICLSNWSIPPGRDKNKIYLSCHHPDLQVFSCLWKDEEIPDFNAIYWLQKETPFQQYWELTESWSSHVASFISNCQLWNKFCFTHTELKRSGLVESRITFLGFEFKNSQTAQKVRHWAPPWH